MKRKGAFFEEVPITKVNRNFFDLSHERKTTGKFGYLYPVLCMDTLPGDFITDRITAFCRAQPLVSPVYHNVQIKFNAFFVPDRILLGMDLVENFFGSGQTGADASVMPYVTPAGLYAADANNYNNFLPGTLWNRLGLPAFIGADPGPGVWSTEQINARGFYAYQKIWSDWYRDPNFDLEIEFPIETQGDVSAAVNMAGFLQLRKRGWRRDAFVSALPEAQRGNEVLMPLSGFATQVEELDGDPVPAQKYLGILPGSPGTLAYGDSFNPGVATQAARIVFDSSGTSINDFRLALAVQRWQENSMRGGSRYNEMTLVNFDIQPEDYRTQRAEYLGGHTQKVEISEVLSTANTEVDAVETPVGQLAGRGISIGRDAGWSYQCKEHGWVLVIMSVMPDSNYCQGLPGWATRRTRYSYGWPLLANIGEQEVLSKEVFYSFLAADDDDNNEVFGYNPRYWDYKYIQDQTDSDFLTTLQFWHLGRFFLQRPILDEFFTTMNEDGSSGADWDEETFRRIFAVEDGSDYFLFRIFHNLTAKRPLPYYGVPAGLG